MIGLWSVNRNIEEIATLVHLRAAGASPGKATPAILLSPRIDGQKEVELLTPRGYCGKRDGVETTLG